MHPHRSLAAFAHTIHLSPTGPELFYYAAGDLDAPPLLLVHGLGDEADTWRGVLPALAQRFRVYAPDLPGFGRSDALPEGYSLASLSQAIAAFMDSLGIARAVLIGHSLGAALVQRLSLDQPQRAERLVLIGGSLAGGKQPLSLQTLLFLIPGLGELLYRRLSHAPEAAYRSLEPYYFNLAALPVEERDFLRRRVLARVSSRKQERAFLGTLRSLARSFSAPPPDLAALAVPTLAIWGAADRVNPPENVQALLAKLPAARVEIIADAGHNVQQEKPEQVAAALAKA